MLEIVIVGLIVAIIIISWLNDKRCKYPPIIKFHNFLTPEECDYLIYMAKDQLVDSKVYGNDSKDSIDMSHRKSKQTWFPYNTNELTKMISAKSVAITGIPVNLQESIQVVRYESGNYFNFHWDSCSNFFAGDSGRDTIPVTDPSHKCYNMDGEYGGPRKYTILVYLSDDFEGGETEFEYLGIKIKAEKGMAVLFVNTDENGHIYTMSKHAGLPVTNGEKWIANIWSHMPNP